MAKYAVEITPKAQWDMDEAFDYIAFQLENPQAAYDLIDGIYSATGDLSSMPERFPVWKRGSMGPKGAGKLNPMLMINLLAWKDAHDGDLPFVALSLYWPEHAPNAFHAVCVGLEDVVTKKAPLADTPPKAKAASVKKDPSDEMPKTKIGKLARAAFPVLFGEGKVTADDVAYLCSKAAEKDFKSRSNQVLKETTGDIEKDACDALGRKRFYAKIVLPFEGKKYLLTSQWYKKGLPNLKSWLAAHGLSSDRIKALA